MAELFTCEAHAWAKIPGTGLEVYGYADKPFSLGVEDDGSIYVSRVLPGPVGIHVRKARS